MYDHDEAAVFAMMCRLQIGSDALPMLRDSMRAIADKTNLEIRVWSPEERVARPNLAICVT
jgi:formyltetrahydrofolate deformylase